MDVGRREAIRQAVHSALRRAAPDLVGAPFEEWQQPGGVQLIHDHLEVLIDIVERAPDAGIDAWRAEVRRRICPGCRDQLSSGFCILREARACTMDAHLAVVAEAIKSYGDAHPAPAAGSSRETGAPSR